MQDCKNEDPAPVGPAYCSTVQPAWKPGLIARGCVGLDMPDMPLPEPPLGGAVCVDIDTADEEKVFNESIFSCFSITSPFQDDHLLVWLGGLQPV